jgi:hypothetical protein
MIMYQDLDLHGMLTHESLMQLMPYPFLMIPSSNVSYALVFMIDSVMDIDITVSCSFTVLSFHVNIISIRSSLFIIYLFHIIV